VSALKKPTHRRWESIDELVKEIDQSTEIPAPPPGGIPNQWLPGLIRWPIRALLLPFILMDTLAQKIARMIIKTPYRQVGKCKKRGNCCHAILLPERKGILGTLQWFWLTQIDGFFLRTPEPIDIEGTPTLVMGCRYLQKNGMCKHHKLRPTTCREWPIIEIFGSPERLPGCGFTAQLRNKKVKDKKKDVQ